MNNLKDLFIEIDIKPNNFKYYEIALTHMSFAHESQNKIESYERIEYFGDSILGKVVSEHLFLKYPNYDQGDMTLIKHFVVNKKYLSEIGRKIKLEKYIKLGAGENRNNLSDSVYEDVFESLVGAIYLDLGPKETKKFIGKYILSKIDSISLDDVKDAKTKLQEHLQSETGKSVEYQTSENKDQNNFYNSIAIFENSKIGKGKGLSKKDAEQDAAKNALERIVLN